MIFKSLKDMGTGRKFLNRTAMACAVRSRTDKWDLTKLHSFCKAKDTVNKTKRPPTAWERIFTNPKSDSGLLSNIYKELKKVDSRKTNNPLTLLQDSLCSVQYLSVSICICFHRLLAGTFQRSVMLGSCLQT
jgi:hypothetical protein